MHTYLKPLGAPTSQSWNDKKYKKCRKRVRQRMRRDRGTTSASPELEHECIVTQLNVANSRFPQKQGRFPHRLPPQGLGAFGEIIDESPGIQRGNKHSVLSQPHKSCAHARQYVRQNNRLEERVRVFTCVCGRMGLCTCLSVEEGDYSFLLQGIIHFC